MAQTTIQVDPTKGQAGSLASALDYVVVSRVAESVVVPGRFVVQGTADNQCTQTLTIGLALGGLGIGVALLDPTRESANYAIGDVVSVLVTGEIWAVTGETVAAGTQASVDYTTLDGALLESPNAGGDDLTNVVFVESVTGAGIAKVRLGNVNF